MNNINPTVVVALSFLVVIIAIFRFRGDLSAGLSALGAKLTLRGRNPEKSVTKSAPVGGGIRRNWFFGNVSAKTKGRSSIEDTLAAGKKVELESEDSAPRDQTRSTHKPRS